MSVAACPACIALPSDEIIEQVQMAQRLSISVPDMRCAACMQKIERAVSEVKGVISARVNLSQKQVMIHRAPEIDIEDAILDAITNLGFEAHLLDNKQMGTVRDTAGHALLMRLGVAGFAAVNVMLLSVSVWAGADGTMMTLLHLISAAIAIPSLFFSAQPFFKSALQALRARGLNMDVPISLAILIAAVMSLYETLIGGGAVYFDAALSLTFFLLAGRYLDHQSRLKARSAAVELSALVLPRAQKITATGICTVDIQELELGDHILVRRGARVPVDGLLHSEAADMDVSILSGESLPMAMVTGAPVFAGSMNLGAPVEICVTSIGQDTRLAEIAQMVATAEASKTRYTSLADRAAQIYAPVVHLLALLAFVFWQFYSGDTRFAITVATAVLIITCPCALGLAVPAVMTVASGRLFRQGVIIRNGTALERLCSVDTVVFDKTGTLTSGDFTISKRPAPQEHRLAQALALKSDHPLCRAITDDGVSGALPHITDIQEISGCGMQGKYLGQTVKLGHAEWVGAHSSSDQVQTWIRFGQQSPQMFQFAERPKPSAKPAIEMLLARGLRVVILSGDRQQSVDRFAQSMGVSQAVGGVLPEEKMRLLRSFGDKVLMIGDGLNDTAALASASVSMAPAKAIDAARAASDFVLSRDDLTLIASTITTAQSARLRMLENFSIAAGYNAVAIPIALVGLASPLLAAIAMSGSSICVSLNALRVKGEA
ncbi:copper-translocating P-type ATPase [Amylibacter marinus]|uniref:Copper-translocating P-type ATPase n=1 Tax=Amylibacter marinus TaxID=1475483 RepID=A0ABQ5VYS3_9RHOB|nr:heavy metal translocating P-type ATPase [Amylibacter marinus]GLQ36289.1 copper-translocating P-type ATPase [Amylibacter marinus]